MLPSTTPRPMYPDHPNLNDLTSPVPMNGQETPAASRRLLNNRTPAAGRITTTPSVSPPNQLPDFKPGGLPRIPESNLNTPAFHSSLFPSSLGGGMDLDLNSTDDWGDGGGGMEDIPEEEAFRGLGLSSVAGTNDVRSVDSSVGMRGSSIIDSPDSQGRKGSSIGVASDGGLRSDIRDMQDMDFSYIAPNTSNRIQGTVDNGLEPMVLGSDYVGGIESDSGDEDEGADEVEDEDAHDQLSAINEEPEQEEEDDDDVDMISIAPSIVSTTRSPSRIAESMTPQPRRLIEQSSMTPQPRRLIDPSSMGPQLSEADTPQTRRFNSQFFSQPGTPVVMGRGVISAGTVGIVGSVDGTDEDEDEDHEVDAMVMASSPPVFRNAAGRVVQRPVPIMSPDIQEEEEDADEHLEEAEAVEAKDTEEGDEDQVTPIPTFASSPPILRRSQQPQPSQAQNTPSQTFTPQAPPPKRTQPFEVVIYTPAKPAKLTQSTTPKSTKSTKLPPVKAEEQDEEEDEEDNEEVMVEQRPFSNLVPGQVWDAPAPASKIRAARASTLSAFSASIQASQTSQASARAAPAPATAASGAPPAQSSTSHFASHSDSHPAQFITPNQPTDQEMPDAPQSNPINRDTPRLGKVRERSEVMSDALEVDDEMMMRGEEFGGESAGNSFHSVASRTHMTIITPRESFAEAVTGRLQAQAQEEEAEEPVLPAPAPRLSEIQQGEGNEAQAHQDNDFEEISSFQFAPETQAHQGNDYEEISSFQFAPEESPDEEFISSFRYPEGHPSSSGLTAAAVAAAKTPTPSPPPPRPQSRAATYLSRILSPFKRTPTKPPPGAPTPKRAFTSFTNSTTPTKPPPTPRRAFGTPGPAGTARSVRFAVPSSSANTSISSIGNATLVAANISTISSIGNETRAAAHEEGNISYPDLNQPSTSLNQPSYPDLTSLSTSYAHDRAQNIARAREVGAITIDSIDSRNAAISAPSTIRTLRQLEGVWEMERQHVRNEAGSKAIEIDDDDDDDMEDGNELDGQNDMGDRDQDSLAGDTTHFKRQLASHLEAERAEQEEREKQEQEQRLRERKREDSVMSSITTWTGSSSESHITSSRSSPPVEADASASSPAGLQMAGNLETAEAEAQAEVQATTQRALEVVREVGEDMEMEDAAETMEVDEPEPQPTPGLRFKSRPLRMATRASPRIRRFGPRATSSTPKKLTPVVEVPVRLPAVAESADNSAIVVESPDNSAIVIESTDNSAIVIPSNENSAIVIPSGENSTILIPDDDDEAPIPEVEVEADTHEAAEADDILSSLAFGSSSSSSLPWTRENYRHLSAVLKSSSTNPRAANKQYSVQIIRSAANRLLAREVVESHRLDGEGMMLLSLKDSAGVERFVRRERLRNRRWDTREVVRRAAGLRIAEVRRRVRGKGVER
jgi:hypothetical protein